MAHTRAAAHMSLHLKPTMSKNPKRQTNDHPLPFQEARSSDLSGVAANQTIRSVAAVTRPLTITPTPVKRFRNFSDIFCETPLYRPIDATAPTGLAYMAASSSPMGTKAKPIELSAMP